MASTTGTHAQGRHRAGTTGPGHGRALPQHGLRAVVQGSAAAPGALNYRLRQCPGCPFTAEHSYGPTTRQAAGTCPHLRPGWSADRAGERLEQRTWRTTDSGSGTAEGLEERFAPGPASRGGRHGVAPVITELPPNVRAGAAKDRTRVRAPPGEQRKARPKSDGYLKSWLQGASVHQVCAGQGIRRTGSILRWQGDALLAQRGYRQTPRTRRRLALRVPSTPRQGAYPANSRHSTSAISQVVTRHWLGVASGRIRLEWAGPTIPASEYRALLDAACCGNWREAGAGLRRVWRLSASAPARWAAGWSLG